MPCRVHGCTQRHNSHYCRLCEDNNSNHFSHACPQGIQLYHVTALSNIRGIAEIGLQPTNIGRLGKGVYFAKNFKDAKDISLHRGKAGGQAAVVFECNVNLGNIKDMERSSEDSWQMGNYDSAQGIHEKWVCDDDFTEFCLKDPKKCSIKRVAVTKGHIDDSGVFYIHKRDRGWRDLQQLDRDPEIDDVKAAARNRSTESRQQEVTIEEDYEEDIKRPCLGIILILTLAANLATFIIQLGSVIVQKSVCGYYSPEIISFIVFLILLSIGRILSFCLMMVKPKASFFFTLAIDFLFEMPMMISNAYIVKTCGEIDGWILALHICYIGHLWFGLITNSCNMLIERCSSSKFIMCFAISFMLPLVMYVPVY